MQVVAQYGVTGGAGVKSLQFGAHRCQHQQRRDQKMPRSAAGVERLQLTQVLGPSVESSGGGRPRAGFLIAHKAQVLQRHAGDAGFLAQFGFALGILQIFGGQAARRPPCTQRIVEKKLTI